MAIVGALLGGYAQQDYKEMHGRLEGGTLALYLSGKDFQVSTSGLGTIAGTISWKKADARPQGNGPACLGLKVQATTQSGYSSAGQQRFAPFTPVGAARISPTPTAAGDMYQCAYAVKNLPVGVPLIVQVSAASGWTTGGGLPVVPRAQPSGWSGVVTVLEGGSGSSSNGSSIRVATGSVSTPVQSAAGHTVEGHGAGANPKGVLAVSGIDFQLIFQQAPQ